MKSHHSVVRPILKKYGFGATFFVTEGFDFPTNKKDYMTWDEIAELHADGFEIGNHTRDHLGVEPGTSTSSPSRCGPSPSGAASTASRPGLLRLAGERRSTRRRSAGPQGPAAFASPVAAGRRSTPTRRARGIAYEPGLDHPLLIPSAGDARPDWTIDDFIAAVEQARRGRIAVLQFHGVPDRAHPWVHTPPEQFEAYMKYLAENGYQGHRHAGPG